MQRTVLHALALSFLASCSYFESGGTAGVAETGTAARPDGASAQPTPTRTSSDLAALVPKDAVAYVELASLDEVDGLLREVAAMADDPMVGAMASTDALLPLALGSGDVSLVDRSRPLAVSVSLSNEAEPQPAFFVPCLDPDGFAESMGTLPGSPVPRVEGAYVVIAHSPDYRPGGGSHALATGVPEGQFAARVDLASVVGRLRPMIDVGLAQAEGMAQAQGLGAADAAVIETFESGADTFLDSAETLELGFSVRSGEMDFTLAFTAKEGSPLAQYASTGTTHMTRLARFLDPEAAFSFCVGADAALLSERVEPFLAEALPETPEGRRAAAFLPLFSGARRTLGTKLAISGDLGREGARFSWFCKPRDEEGFFGWFEDGLHQLDEQAPYMELDGPAHSTLDGVAVTQWTFRVPEAGEDVRPERVERQRSEVAEVFGADELVLRTASNGDHFALVVGGDDAYFQEAVAKLAGPTPAPAAAVERALSWVAGANPAFVVSVDVARATAQATDLMLRLTELTLGENALAGAGIAFPDIPDERVPLTYYGAIEGRTWRIGSIADLPGLVRAMESAQGSY